MRFSSSITLLSHSLSFVLLTTLASPLSVAHAQGAVVKQSREGSDTLAGVLRTLPGDGLGGARLLIAANSENVKPPATAAGAGAASAARLGAIEDVCAKYHRAFSRFGDVGAVPPATMTVLRLPSLPSLTHDSITLETALNVFLSMLTEDQIKQLGGDGLNLNDLSSDQKDFYRNVVARPLPIISNANPNPFQMGFSQAERLAALRAYRASVQTLPMSAMEGAARLHASLCASYEFTRDEDSGSLAVETDTKDVQAQSDYSLSFFTPPAFRAANENPFLASVKATTGTVLKPGDLDWSRQELAAPLIPGEYKTVGALVTAAGRASGLELYCDPHFAKKSLVYIGEAAREYSLSELLEAVTISVCGAWRKVGPAYVLTNDVAGVGFRRAAIRETIAPWEAHVKDLNEDAKQAQGEKHLPELLKFRSDDPLSVPVAQIQGDRDDDDAVSVSFGDLPMELQGVLRKRLRTEVQRVPVKSDDPDDASPFLRSNANQLFQAVDPDFSVKVSAGIQMIVDIPSFGSVSLSTYQAAIPLNNPDNSEDDDSDSDAAPVPARAVALLATPSSETEARALVDRMAETGVKTLYCTAFANGITYCPSKTAPPTADHAGVLAAAADEGKIKGVTVYAALDLMQWNTETPRSDSFDWSRRVAPETTITGKTATEAMAAAMLPLKKDPNSEIHTLTRALQSGGWPSLIDPETHRMMCEIAADAASTPGIAGVLLSKICPPGYGNIPVITETYPIDLGYGDAIRLNYLRAHSQDPIDISAPNGSLIQLDESGRASMQSQNLRIPEYDNFDDDTDYLLSWSKYRNKIWAATMSEVFGAVKKANPALKLQVRDYVSGMTVFPWTDPKVNPVMPEDGDPASDNARQIFPVGLTKSDDMLKMFVLQSTEDRKGAPLDLAIFDLDLAPISRGLLDEVSELGKTFDFQHLPGVIVAPEKPQALIPH